MEEDAEPAVLLRCCRRWQITEVMGRTVTRTRVFSEAASELGETMEGPLLSCCCSQRCEERVRERGGEVSCYSSCWYGKWSTGRKGTWGSSCCCSQLERFGTREREGCGASRTAAEPTAAHEAEHGQNECDLCKVPARRDC